MTKSDPLLSDELANADLSQFAALQQKRTLAFVNHFVVTTVQFLNNFMKKCEEDLMKFERKLEKVEAGLVLLESRLSSIPEVSRSTDEVTPQPVQNTLPTPTDHVDKGTENNTSEDSGASKEDESCEPAENNTVPPEYERFVKMVQVGVPLQAVKLKVSVEGLDPNVLDRALNK